MKRDDGLRLAICETEARLTGLAKLLVSRGIMTESGIDHHEFLSDEEFRMLGAWSALCELHDHLIDLIVPKGATKH